MKSSTQDGIVFASIVAGVLLLIFVVKVGLFATPESMIQVISSGFREGSDISKNYTCDGEGKSIALSFDNVPKSAQTLALVMQDLDVPRSEFVHWIVYGISPAAVFEDNKLPAGAVQGLNSQNKSSYVAICPPAGKTHRYQLTVYGINKSLDLKTIPDLKKLKAAIRGHVVAKGMVTAHYTRKSASQ